MASDEVIIVKSPDAKKTLIPFSKHYGDYLERTI